MPIFNIFSKRQKALRGEFPDTYRYNDIPESLRVQIIHIMYDALGDVQKYNSEVSYPRVKKTYDFIERVLCREYGVFRLPANYSERESKILDITVFFLGGENVENVLDVIELSFQAIDRYTRTLQYLGKLDPSGDADRAIEELNARFNEHGVGYSFVDGQIVRIDSEFIHSEVVRPALGILNRREYTGAQEEFLKAHEHYRKGNAKEALNECLKSLESVMKSICDKRGWPYDDRATASKLVDICFDNGLVPSLWQSQFDSLRSLLKSGVPPVRNKLGGHGQGATPKPVPDYIAGYALHMTAAAIVFLADAEAEGAP